jgi:hypothetical protein
MGIRGQRLNRAFAAFPHLFLLDNARAGIALVFAALQQNRNQGQNTQYKQRSFKHVWYSKYSE